LPDGGNVRRPATGFLCIARGEDAHVIIELLKALLIGVVEGLTEWLPISSTGHMILVDEFVKLNVSPEFLKVFLVVIQLGAIMAVIVLYFRKLNPFALSKTRVQRRHTWGIWGKVIVATIPAGIVGVLFDDWVQDNLYGALVVSIALIFYGIVFIVMERRNRRRMAEANEPLGKHSRGYLAAVAGGEEGSSSSPDDLPVDWEPASEQDYEDAPNGAVLMGVDGKKHYVEKRENDESAAISKVNSFSELSIGRALGIGLFQCLAVIPGTSRSGATIIGAMLLGVSRTVAAEFSFFLAIPVMFGWSIVQIIKYGLAFSATEMAILAVGCVTAFVVSILSIRFLIGYIKRNDFTAFGWYRIALGLVVIGVLIVPTLL
jgi:undecaprenyl-diphosphatase